MNIRDDCATHTEMDRFARDDLRQLAEIEANPAVTIYMPTYRAGREVRQNATRFKNMIKSAYSKLTDAGVDDQHAESLLADVSDLAQDGDWWQHQSDGLAIFLTDQQCDYYRLPTHVGEFVSVGPRFHVRPLLRLVQVDGRFYVLAISQNSVRLLEGTRYGVEELQPERLPSDLRSALNIDEHIRTLQQHSTGGANVAGSMIFHGQGGADMDVQKKDEITQYFHRISGGLASLLHDDQAPLVFAGVDYLFPLFRKTCDYRGLVEQPVTGSPDELAAGQLHELAWQRVEPVLSRHIDTALAQYRDQIAGEKASDDVATIIRAAQQGAIDTLLLAEGERCWGAVDEQGGSIVITDETADSAEELLNYAAVRTLTSGGDVYSVEPESIPHGKPAAALLRYALA